MTISSVEQHGNESAGCDLAPVVPSQRPGRRKKYDARKSCQEVRWYPQDTSDLLTAAHDEQNFVSERVLWERCSVTTLGEFTMTPPDQRAAMTAAAIRDSA